MFAEVLNSVRKVDGFARAGLDIAVDQVKFISKSWFGFVTTISLIFIKLCKKNFISPILGIVKTKCFMLLETAVQAP